MELPGQSREVMSPEPWAFCLAHSRYLIFLPLFLTKRQLWICIILYQGGQIVSVQKKTRNLGDRRASSGVTLVSLRPERRIFLKWLELVAWLDTSYLWWLSLKPWLMLAFKNCFSLCYVNRVSLQYGGMLVLIKFRKEGEGVWVAWPSWRASVKNHFYVWSVAFENRINNMKERTSPNRKIMSMLKLSYIVLILA